MLPLPRKPGACLAVATCVLASVAGARGPTSRPTTRPTVAEVSTEAIQRSLRRGTAFLVGWQNDDGSWGSARRTKGLNIACPVPAGHDAFRLAVTALCVSALIEAGGDADGVCKAVDRGEACLLAELPKLRRSSRRYVYNTWAHAYGIRALVRLHRLRADEPRRRERLAAAIAGQIRRLVEYEAVHGGWGYIDWRMNTKRPTPLTTSFLAGTCLIALREAADAGMHVPAQLVRRAVASIHRQRNPDFSYHYSELFWRRPAHEICRPPGSLGRSQVCNLALRLWGFEGVTDDVLATWLDRLIERNGWLSRARKMPVPHESWYRVAGYFFYYGHFYAAACAMELPPARRKRYRRGLAGILVPLQERDGSWWDYPMYDYHKGWGTAYAMMALSRCLPVARQRSAGVAGR